MKEKPICVEQGQKLAKEVMQPLQILFFFLQTLKINVNEAKVVIEANIYCAFTICRHCDECFTCIRSFNPRLTSCSGGEKRGMAMSDNLSGSL